jgi:hypothetical protein
VDVAAGSKLFQAWKNTTFLQNKSSKQVRPSASKWSDCKPISAHKDIRIFPGGDYKILKAFAGIKQGRANFPCI